MRTVLKWLADKNRREMLAFVGGGVVVVIGAAWTALTFWLGKAEVPQKVEANYSVCVGSKPEGCPANAVFLRCGESVAAWAQKECGAYTQQAVSAKSGGMCGYAVVQIKCTSGKY